MKHDTKEENQGDWGLNYEPGFGCQMTMISQLYHKMELGLPAFAIVEFFMHWAFIASFAVFLAYHGHYKQTYLSQSLGADYAQLSLTDGDDGDEDLNLFLKSTLNKDSGKGAHLEQRVQQDRMQGHDAYYDG